jgi:hypothetical protein
MGWACSANAEGEECVWDIVGKARGKGPVGRPRRRWVGNNRCGKNICRLLVRKPEGKRPLARPRRRWIDNIKMDILEIGLSVVDWIGLAQDRYRWRALVTR